MPHPRARVVAAVAAAVVLLPGCTLSGSVVVRSPSLVEVDLTWMPPPSDALVRTGVEGCLLDSTTVTTLDFTRRLAADGTSVCRVVGHARLDELQRWFGYARQVDDRAQVEFFPAGRVPDAVAEYQLRAFTDLDVTVTFPGPVGSHLGGQADGNGVRFTDAAEFVRNRGLAASGPARAAEEPAPETPGWVVPVASGAGALVVGLAVGAALGRSRRTGRPAEDEPRAEPRRPHPRRPDDPGEWSHE